MTALALAILAVAAVAAVVILALAVRRLTQTMASLERTMEAMRTERPTHHRREPPAIQPTPGSHPVIKVMAFKAGASRAARHLRGG